MVRPGPSDTRARYDAYATRHGTWPNGATKAVPMSSNCFPAVSGGGRSGGRNFAPISDWTVWPPTNFVA
jgi:hypothetical protein